IIMGNIAVFAFVAGNPTSHWEIRLLSRFQENVPVGTLVYTFNAKDGDGSFLNSKIQYSLEMSNMGENLFLIHPLYGTLTTAFPLDREITHSVILTVSAADQAINLTDRRLDSLAVKIAILDINDNSPSFTSSPHSYVMEDVEVGFLVHHIIAKDPDEGRNGQVTYRILSGNENKAFVLDKITGTVTSLEFLVLSQFLDREIQECYSLTVIALDDGSPALSATQVLTIIVLDVNDENPVFLKQLYETAIHENQDQGEFVIKVEAVDSDAGNFFMYSLIDDTFGAFAINSSVFTTGPVTQLEKISIIQLLIEATDGGSPTLSAVTSVEVHVEDVNNYAPQFTKVMYNLSVSEDASVGESVLVFSAIDYDWTHENTYVEYSIIDGNAENLFSVETSVMESETSYKLVGSLVLSSVLDRETAASHHLVLLASNRGTPSLNSTATVLITVLDVNDKPPVFSSPDYHIHVKESIPVGSHITEVSANDCDAGANAEISYAIISGNDRGHFRLDGKTGSVDLMKTLDYEDTMKFTLIVQATDGGADVKNVAFSVVLVSVLDDNDYAPLFLFPSLSCIVSENLPTFSFVCAVNALDFDKGSYGHLTYSIQSSCLAHREAPRDHDMFFIDPLTGDIHTKQMFDYESQNRYCLIIQAKDKGDSLATITVQVDIEGRDEFDPVFTQDQYFFNLPEKNEAGQLLGRVTASDSDGGLDGVVHYSLLKTSPFFSVNQTSGNIYLTQTVHRNKNGSKRNDDDTLELLVRAHSPKIESKFTVCTVLVNISNSPESYPIVSAYSLTISVSMSPLSVPNSCGFLCKSHSQVPDNQLDQFYCFSHKICQ
uniref:Cadherin domain-containing protein n=1 Tax=Athene cunicularia TaxID=194338 RepID=A0A663LQX8_ATHCN